MKQIRVTKEDGYLDLRNSRSTIHTIQPTFMDAGVQTLTNRLRSYFKDRPFRYGCADFPPFLKVNGNISGHMTKLMMLIAADLDTYAEPVHTTWESFHEDYEAQNFDTMAAPIISTESRKYNVVDYTVLTSGALVCLTRDSNRDVADQVERYVSQYRTLIWEAKINPTQRPCISLEYLCTGPPAAQTTMLLHNLQKATPGIVAFRGFLEHDIIKELYVDITPPPGNGDMIAKSANAIRNGFVVAIDFRTAQKVSDLLEQEDMRVNVESLFAVPLRVWAGFPFHGRATEMNLLNYFQHHCNSERGIISTFLQDHFEANGDLRKLGVVPLTPKTPFMRLWSTGRSPCAAFPDEPKVKLQNVQVLGQYLLRQSLHESVDEASNVQQAIRKVGGSLPSIDSDYQVGEVDLEAEVLRAAADWRQYHPIISKARLTANLITASLLILSGIAGGLAFTSFSIGPLWPGFFKGISPTLLLLAVEIQMGLRMLERLALNRHRN